MFSSYGIALSRRTGLILQFSDVQFPGCPLALLGRILEGLLYTNNGANLRRSCYKLWWVLKLQTDLVLHGRLKVQLFVNRKLGVINLVTILLPPEDTRTCETGWCCHPRLAACLDEVHRRQSVVGASTSVPNPNCTLISKTCVQLTPQFHFWL